MVRKLGLLAVVLVSISSNCFASDETNQRFYQRCKNESFEGAGGYCNGPFEIFLQTATTNGRAGMFCPPSQQVSMQQYANIYFRWVENNPKYLGDDFFQGINLALSNAFPCNNRGAQQ